nr:ABC-type transport auxiliary lipoprotein family protein [Pseudomonas aeruginosa]
MRLALRPLRRLSLAAGLAALATLGACSILPEAQVLQVYLLPVHNPPASAAARPVDWSLRIARPRTSLVLESPRIAVRPHGDEISVYQGARWSDPAPSLLRDRLMQAFQADGRVRGLSSDDSNLQADFELGGDLRAFQTEYPNGQASALIRYDARPSRAAPRWPGARHPGRRPRSTRRGARGSRPGGFPDSWDRAGSGSRRATAPVPGGPAVPARAAGPAGW